MSSLRTIESENVFQEYRKTHPQNDGCIICERQGLKDFKFWKIIPNDFPYDKIAETHHMIVPLRHVTEDGLNVEELKELKEIKDTVLHTEYEYIIEATYKKKSIPEHFHLHLIVAKS